MPRIVRFYLMCIVIGFAAAAVFTGAILWWNVANLGHLVMTSDIGLMAAFLLWFFNGIVFTGVQAVWSVMQMAENPDD